MHAIRIGTMLAVGCVWIAACDEDTTTSGSSSSLATGSSSGGSSSGGSSSTASTGGGTNGDAIEEFCNAVVDPFCEALFACCMDATELASFGGSVEACSTQFGAECRTELEEVVGPLLASGVTTLDSARLASCVSTLESLAAGSCTQPPQFVRFLCFMAFEGSVVDGEACSNPNDASFVECAEGYCRDATCEAFLPSDAPCTPGDDNAGFCNLTEGQWCISSTSTCGPRLEAGESCTPAASGYDYECLSLQCVSGQCAPPDADTLCAEGA